MTLSQATIDEHARTYEEQEPLYAVEAEQIETLPGALADGQYGWRDVAWLVRWYYRRHLGAHPDEHRRAVEEAFGDNDFEAIRSTIEAVTAESAVGVQLAALTELEGVDVGVASGMLMFMDPAQRIAIGEREWTALETAGELDGGSPDAFGAPEYATYHRACQTICERVDRSMWTLYRALWRLGARPV